MTLISHLFVAGVEYVTGAEAVERLGDDVTTDMIRDWVKRGLLKPAGRYGGRGNLYRLVDVALAERNTRVERRGRTRRAGQLQKPALVGHNLPTETQVDAARITCGVIRDNGRHCNRTAVPGAPLRICRDHMRAAYLHWKDCLPEVCGFDSTELEARLEEPKREFQAKKSLRESSPFVYYVRFGDRVKIGHSADVRGRLANLPHDELLALEPGPIDLERMRHRQFAAHKVKGEWFRQHSELLSHIAMLVSHYGTAQAQLDALY